MGQRICGQCGGTNFEEVNGNYVCQDCGSEWTEPNNPENSEPENAADLEELYQTARQAMEDKNWEGAMGFYEKILDQDPASWEAAFYSVYLRALPYKVADIQDACRSLTECFDSVLILIMEQVEPREEQIRAITDVVSHCNSIADSMYTTGKIHYRKMDNAISDKHIQEMVDNCSSARELAYHIGNTLKPYLSAYPELEDSAVAAWDCGIEMHKELMYYYVNKEANKSIIMGYVDKIQKYQPSYERPVIITVKEREKREPTNRRGNCYIATMVYGSYDCPQVWTLRRYRDSTLAGTWYGRTFIRVYYKLSPILIRLLGRFGWFHAAWKGILDKMVSNLNRSGVEDTPYQDRDW